MRLFVDSSRILQGVMHMYQKHILDLLRRNDTQRYSDLQPDGVESSHFKYHLNQLLNAGFVEHQSRGVYSLTDKGKTRVDSLSDGGVLPEQTPKVITYTLLYDDANYYFYKKDKDPYRGLLNMIGGKLHLDEDPGEAAQRELREKIQLKVGEIELRGVANITINQAGNLLTHAVAYVLKTDVTGMQLPETLHAVSKSNINVPDDLAPDLLEILNTSESNELFVKDIRIDI